MPCRKEPVARTADGAGFVIQLAPETMPLREGLLWFQAGLQNEVGKPGIA